MLSGRSAFALACILGMFAIATAAALETVRYRRGEGIVGRGQFRLRLVSSLVWLLVLGVNLYAVTALWPAAGHSPAAREQARHFLWAIGAGFSLLIVALLLLMADLKQIAGARQHHEARFRADLASLTGDAPAEFPQSPL